MSPQRALDWNAVVIGKGAAVPEKTILRGAANTVLTQVVVNEEPAFTKLNAATMVTGVIPPANGGTGLDTSASTGVAQVTAGTWSVSAIDLATADVTGVLPIANGGSRTGFSVLTYGTTIGVPNAGAANWFVVQVTNAAAHAFPAPINGTAGQMITLSVQNTSGGVIATATFASPAYRVAGYVAPAAGFIASGCFLFSGSSWFLVAPWMTVA